MNDDELSDSGSPIHRYAARQSDWSPPEHHALHLQEIEAHIEAYIGKVEKVFHEILSDLVHLDVLMVPAAEGRPYQVLVTSGMGDLPMAVPEGLESFNRAELLIFLPPDWPLTGDALNIEEYCWPVGLLKMVGRFPHEYNTWIGLGHSIPNGDPPRPIANTNFTGVMVSPPHWLPIEFFQLSTKSEETLTFYALTPIYQEEMDLKLKKGADLIEERLAKRKNGFVLDVNRPNVALRRRWFGR